MEKGKVKAGQREEDQADAPITPGSKEGAQKEKIKIIFLKEPHWNPVLNRSIPGGLFQAANRKEYEAVKPYAAAVPASAGFSLG